MTRIFRRVVSVFAVSAVVVLMSNVAPASAVVADATISGTIQNASAQTLANAEVYLYNDTGFAEVFSDQTGPILTGADGHFSIGAADGLTPGDWTLEVDDTTGTYVSSITQVTVVAGANDAGTLTLQLGSTISGKVTSPSGKALKNVGMTAFHPDGKLPWDGFAVTGSTGKFALTGLDAPFTYKVYIWFFSPFTGAKLKLTVPISDRGVTVGDQNITNVKAEPVASLTGKSSAKGKATLKVSFLTGQFGIANPTGKVSVYLGKKKIKTFSIKHGKGNVTLTSQKKGNRTYKIVYGGSTDITKSTSNSVTVKVK